MSNDHTSEVNHNLFSETHHPELKRVFHQLPELGTSDSPVLILGESGTGKELMAQSIHNASRRSEGPFIPVNCSAIPENLFEAELFGISEGTATTGVKARRGLIELAHGGTLFLDELGDLPFPLQAKLLRTLQNHQIAPVGSSGEDKEIDFRVISATNTNLETLIRSGKFREDLFYRLNVITINMPPLRERLMDMKNICTVITSQLTTERSFCLKISIPFFPKEHPPITTTQNRQT